MPGGPCKENQGKWMKRLRPHRARDLSDFPPGSPRTARVSRQLMSKQNVKVDVKPFTQFIQSSNKCLLSSYYVPGTGPRAREHSNKQNIKIPASWRLHPRGEVGGR